MCDVHRRKWWTWMSVALQVETEHKYFMTMILFIAFSIYDNTHHKLKVIIVWEWIVLRFWWHYKAICVFIHSTVFNAWINFFFYPNLNLFLVMTGKLNINGKLFEIGYIHAVFLFYGHVTMAAQQKHSVICWYFKTFFPISVD